MQGVWHNLSKRELQIELRKILPYFLKRSCEFSLFWVLLSENINSHEYGANLLLELEHWVKSRVKYSCSLDLPQAQAICCSVVKTLSNCLTVLFTLTHVLCVRVFASKPVKEISLSLIQFFSICYSVTPALFSPFVRFHSDGCSYQITHIRDVQYGLLMCVMSCLVQIGFDL